MKLTTSQVHAIKNAIAAQFDPYHNPKHYNGSPDPRAWEGADIPTRQSLDIIIRKLRKIV